MQRGNGTSATVAPSIAAISGLRNRLGCSCSILLWASGQAGARWESSVRRENLGAT